MPLWIESHVGLREHPKVRRFIGWAIRNGVAREHALPLVVGTLHLMWWYAIVYSPEGDLSDWSPDDLAYAAAWPGDPEALRDALVEFGFLEHGPDGRLVIHDWYDFAGRLLDKREAATDGKRGNHLRWHVGRDVTSDDCEFCIAPDIAPDSGTIRDPNPNRTVPNRTEPSHKPRAAEPRGRVSSESFAADFAEFWTAYPRKLSKGSAERAYVKARRGGVSPSVILEALDQAKRGTWANRPLDKIPYASSWLNAKGWEDEPESPPIEQLPVSHQPFEQVAT